MALKQSTSRSAQDRSQKAAQARKALAARREPDSDSDSDEDTGWEFVHEDEADDAEASVNAAAGNSVKDESAPASGRPRPRRQAAQTARRRSGRIIAAKHGDFQCSIGECVMVLNDIGRNEVWTGLIYGFEVDETNLDGEPMRVLVKWFANPSEVPVHKRRSDVLENEVYLSPHGDSCPVGSIDEKAKIMSLEKYSKAYPQGLPKKSKDHGKVAVCRRGCDYKSGVFTPEFTWEERYQATEASASALLDWISSVTSGNKPKRKRRFGKPAEEDDGGGDFVPGKRVAEDEEARTPRKRQKHSAVSTPQKLRTPSKLLTPSHRRVVIKKPLEITPLGTRVISPSAFFASPFQTARSRLHVSSVPDALPCREDEFATVYTHLETAINDGSGACIYISGTPGTGKTATVREVVAQLNAAVYDDELEPFTFIEINGMKVTDPHQSYALLWEALKGDRVSPSHALDLLEREFNHPSPRRTPCVVLMDELDQLVTKNQSVMYNFFNWPGLRHSKLIVLAVANTMDLPERTLSNKISSRLGLTRITFPGYTHDQLIKIIQSRLDGVPGNIVEPDAVQFASRKVAAVSGDARRALDICRRAVELAEAEANENDAGSATPSKTPRTEKVPQRSTKLAGRVTIATVKKAINEATTSPLQQYLRVLPLAAKILLAALTMRSRRTGVAESMMGDVLDEARRMALTDNKGDAGVFLLQSQVHRSNPPGRNNKAPRVYGLAASAMELVEAGIIGLESQRCDRAGKVRLAIGDEDIKLAFKDDPQVKSMGLAL